MAKKLELKRIDKEELERIVRSGNTSASLVRRARMILLYAECASLKDVAEELESDSNNVSKWRDRFIENGVQGLKDAPRMGRPIENDRKELIQRVKALLEESPPKGRGRWNGVLLAQKLKVNKHVLWEVLREAGISIDRKRSWCVSTDPEFAKKSADIIGLYLNPPTNALVISVDEKPQMQAIERTQGYVKSSDGEIVRGLQSTYKRNGTLNLFAALEVHTGIVKGKTTESKKRKDFLIFMDSVVRDLSKGSEIHVILDNHSIHKNVDEWLQENPNVHFHYTPTSASWLNQIEVWFSLLQRNSLEGFSASSTKDLAQQVKAYIAETNKNPKPFVWRKREVKGAQLRNNISNLIN